MDLSNVLTELRTEKQKIEAAIAELERLAESSSGKSGNVSKRRGRKSMGPEERIIISQRIKKYWEKRRRALSK